MMEARSQPHRRVLVVGNATIDVIQTIARFPLPGETLLAAQTLLCAGGKGLNQAVAAARTGAPVTLVTPRGEDANGRFLMGALAGETGLAIDWHVKPVATDLSSIWIDAAGENAIVSSAEAAASLTPDEARAACANLQLGDVLLVQGNLGAETTSAALQEARARGATTILNTAPMRGWMGGCLPLADIVVANAVEAAELASGTANAEAALLAAGAATLVISRGGSGATLATERGLSHVPAPPVTALDTSGAGDGLAGTLAGLIAQRLMPETALAIAVAAASLSVTRPGTTPSFPSQAEVAALRDTAARREERRHA